MQVKLKVGNVRIKINIERNIYMTSNIQKHIYDGDYDVNVNITWNKTLSYLPRAENYLGEDLLTEYYKDKNTYYCLTKAGNSKYLMQTSYKENDNHFYVQINDDQFEGSISRIEKILGYLPLKEILLRHDNYLCHSSQIIVNNKGIVFIGPSGIGKTTQSKLWKKYKHADIECNDRTVLFKKDDGWLTTGFITDGSEPIQSININRLAAIVILNQAKENDIQRLGLSDSFSKIIPNIIYDYWNSKAYEKVANMILDIYQDIPVYVLNCRKDATAVECLYDQLRKDGIL